jgi:hypothetical protein
LVAVFTTHDAFGAPDPAVRFFDSRFPKLSKPYPSVHCRVPSMLSDAVARRLSESYVYVIVSPLIALYMELILPLLAPVG